MADNFKYIQPESDEGKKIYALMRELIDNYHTELKEAKIALAWNYIWKADIDGNLTLGKCKRASDLDRSVPYPFDFIIILLYKFWHDPNVNDMLRRALLDHELCHATTKIDNNGEPVRDDSGKIIYRSRRHEIEDFVVIVERYGTYVPQMEKLAFILRELK